MIGFDVFLNGEKLCRAAIGKYGVVSCGIVWHGPSVLREGQRRLSRQNAWLNISGLTGEPGRPGEGSHLDWIHSAIQVGDEVTFKVVDVDDCDPPTRARPPLRFVPKGLAPTLVAFAAPEEAAPARKRKPRRW